MKQFWFSFCLLISLYLLSHGAQALELFHSDTSNTTEIIADQGMVCDQNQKQCMAEGHIQVKRGKSVLTCDKLIAYFDQGQSGKKELKMLEAIGHVHISSKEDGYDATSTYGRYDVGQQLITLRGNPVIKHSKIEIYGTGEIAYDQIKNRATTLSRATLKRQDKLLQANELIVYFKTSDEQQEKAFDHLIANGNVILSSPAEIAKGEHGSYYEATDTAELWENVIISSNDGQIRGQRARVDMTSGKSQMLHPAKGLGDQRVQALLLPKNKGNATISSKS